MKPIHRWDPPTGDETPVAGHCAPFHDGLFDVDVTRTDRRRSRWSPRGWVHLAEPGILASTPFGVTGLVGEAPAAAFYLGAAAFAYSIGESIVFQSFDGAGVQQEIGIAHDQRGRSLVRLHADEQALVQGVTPAGHVVKLGHDEVEDSDFSVQPGRRWLRFVDPETWFGRS